jgi:hypothetical protein
MHLNDCYIPLLIDPNPLKDLYGIFRAVENNVYTTFEKDILKPELIELFDSRNLKVAKVVIWQWDLTFIHDHLPHTDGDVQNPKRTRVAGINWLIYGDSVVDFWKIENAKSIYRENSVIHFTEWDINNEMPYATWDGKIPSLVNPQIPHRVRKTGTDNIRRSVVVSFDNTIPFNVVKERLSDIFYVK